MALRSYVTSLLCFLRMRDGEILALQLFADEEIQLNIDKNLTCQICHADIYFTTNVVFDFKGLSLKSGG